MKILVIGDPHGKLPSGLKSIIKRNKVEGVPVGMQIMADKFDEQKMFEFGSLVEESKK